MIKGFGVSIPSAANREPSPADMIAKFIIIYH